MERICLVLGGRTADPGILGSAGSLRVEPVLIAIAISVVLALELWVDQRNRWLKTLANMCCQVESAQVGLTSCLLVTWKLDEAAITPKDRVTHDAGLVAQHVARRPVIWTRAFLLVTERHFGKQFGVFLLQSRNGLDQSKC